MLLASVDFVETVRHLDNSRRRLRSSKYAFCTPSRISGDADFASRRRGSSSRHCHQVSDHRSSAYPVRVTQPTRVSVNDSTPGELRSPPRRCQLVWSDTSTHRHRRSRSPPFCYSSRRNSHLVGSVLGRPPHPSNSTCQSHSFANLQKKRTHVIITNLFPCFNLPRPFRSHTSPLRPFHNSLSFVCPAYRTHTLQ